MNAAERKKENDIFRAFLGNIRREYMKNGLQFGASLAAGVLGAGMLVEYGPDVAIAAKTTASTIFDPETIGHVVDAMATRLPYRVHEKIGMAKISADSVSDFFNPLDRENPLALAMGRRRR